MGDFRFAGIFSAHCLCMDFCFRVKPSARIFLADRHYFLDFFTMFNNKHLCGMKYKSFMHFFFFLEKLTSISCLSMRYLLACFDCIYNPIVGGFQLLKVKLNRAIREASSPGKFKFSEPH